MGGRDRESKFGYMGVEEDLGERIRINMIKIHCIGREGMGREEGGESVVSM